MRRAPSTGLKAFAVAFGFLALVLAPAAFGQAPRDHWVGTWTTAVIGRPPYPPAPATPAVGGPGQNAQTARLTFPNNQTLREIVHATVGGGRVRVVFTNVFGTTPLRIGAAHIALRQKDAELVPGSDRGLTFSGSKDITVPAGAIIVSDPVSLSVSAYSDLAIDLFLPGDTDGQTLTVHRGAYQTSYLSASGNHAGESDLPDAAKITAWYFLADVEVGTADRAPVIIAIGDSITDGTGSTVDANSRWPDVLARRFADQKKSTRVAVLNAGIAGNRVLSEGIPEFGMNILARFDRDVLLHPAVTHVVVMEGINDIGNARDNASPSAAELIAGQKQLIERAHTRGLKAIGATLTPFEGAAYYTETGEAKRQALNEWIRTGHAFDGVIDFDAAVRDPQQPKRFAPPFDRGDHLHLTDAGYQAMANAVDLRLFK